MTRIKATPEFEAWLKKQTEKSKMPKAKTFKKHVKSLHVKPLAKSYKPGTNVSLEGLKEAIIQALFEGDQDTFKGCISILLDLCDYKDITKETGLSKSTLYRMCEPNSNPTLENIGKVLSYINSLETLSAA